MFQEMVLRMSRNGEKYASLDANEIFDRVATFTINNEIAGYTNGGAVAQVSGGKRHIVYAQLTSSDPATVLNKYVSNTLAELLHHAKEKGTYSDRDLDNAAKSIMTPTEYQEAKKNAKGDAGKIGHALLAKYCNTPN